MLGHIVWSWTNKICFLLWFKIESTLFQYKWILCFLFNCGDRMPASSYEVFFSISHCFGFSISLGNHARKYKHNSNRIDDLRPINLVSRLCFFEKIMWPLQAPLFPCMNPHSMQYRFDEIIYIKHLVLPYTL